MKTYAQILSAGLVLAAAGVLTLSLPKPVAAAAAKPSGLNVETLWQKPNGSPYPPGLSTRKTVTSPMAFEETTAPRTGEAVIEVAGGAQPLTNQTAWMREIRYQSTQIAINHTVYVIPGPYRHNGIFFLPLARGLVWAPASRGTMPSTGWSPIFYTPYRLQGGSLALHAQTIASLPHAWRGLDGPAAATAWTGWLPSGAVAPARVGHLVGQYAMFSGNRETRNIAITVSPSPWSALLDHQLARAAYYGKPHYAANIMSLTRTYGGMVLQVGFRRLYKPGENAGLSMASYYWSETTHKWTPISQDYTVQTVPSWTNIGSDGVYGEESLPYKNGLAVVQTAFNPATLSLHSIWVGEWFYGASVVEGNAWLVVLPQEQPSWPKPPKSWTIYAP